MIVSGTRARSAPLLGSPEYITDIHRRLEALNAQVEELYEIMPFGSYLTTSDGTILSINSAAAVLFGKEPKELVGRLVPIDCFSLGNAELVAQLFEPDQGNFDDSQLILTGEDGMVCEVLISGRQLRDFEGPLGQHRFSIVKVRGKSQNTLHRSSKGVDMVCRHIAGNGPPHLTSSEMATLAGLTTRTLHYAFRQRFGCTPIEWQRAHFLDLAHQILMGDHASTSVKAVARRSGFASTAQFSRFYKRRFGHNPSDQAPQHSAQASR